MPQTLRIPNHQRMPRPFPVRQYQLQPCRIRSDAEDWFAHPFASRHHFAAQRIPRDRGRFLPLPPLCVSQISSHCFLSFRLAPVCQPHRQLYQPLVLPRRKPWNLFHPIHGEAHRMKALRLPHRYPSLRLPMRKPCQRCQVNNPNPDQRTHPLTQLLPLPPHQRNCQPEQPYCRPAHQRCRQPFCSAHTQSPDSR